MTLDATMKRAYRLWSQYKTTTPEYKAIAVSLYKTPLELNAICSRYKNRKRQGAKA